MDLKAAVGESGLVWVGWEWRQVARIFQEIYIHSWRRMAEWKF